MIWEQQVKHAPGLLATERVDTSRTAMPLVHLSRTIGRCDFAGSKNAPPSTFPIQAPLPNPVLLVMAPPAVA